MEEWKDYVLGIGTGGMYTVGKEFVKASKTVEKVRETAEKTGMTADKVDDLTDKIADGAGTALAVLSSTVTKLGTDMSSFLNEMEELLTTKRLTPRDEDDLWDEEVERLNALRRQEADLLAQLNKQGAFDYERSQATYAAASYLELVTRTKLAVVRKAINEILYEELGVVPTSIYNLQQILERFNTLEQPRIEEILDSINDNMEESEEILQEIKKLFVVKTWKAVDELSEEKLNKLKVLEASLANFDQLIAKNTTVSMDLHQTLVHVQPAKFEMAKMRGVTSSIPESGTSTSHSSIPIPGAGSSSVPSFALRRRVSTKASVATSLNQNVVAAYQDNYNTVEGRVRYYSRERLKVEKAIHRIKWVPVEDPGVIPKMLEGIRQTIARFHTEGQPRVENVLDNVNTTVARFHTEGQPRVESVLDNVNTSVVESMAVLSNVNKSLESMQGAFKFLAKYGLYIKIGLFVAGGLTLLILLMSLVVLLRITFGI